MTTVSTIITRAYRETQIVPYNVSPTDDQIAEALPLLQGLVARNTRPPILTLWLGDVSAMRPQKGTIIRDFTPYAVSFALPQDVYLNCQLAEPKEIMLPPAPGDGARLVILDVGNSFGTNSLTLIGNGNLVDGGDTLTLSTSGQTLSLLYRRDLANWTIIPAELGLSQNIPYPEMYDDMFVIELAMRLDPRYGQEIPEMTASIYQSIRSQFTGRYMMVQSSASPDVLFEGWGFFNGNTGMFM